METRRAVANGLVGFARLQYALVEALRADADPARFVIAYRTEQAPRDLTAALCIIAFGFLSREEAEASIKVASPLRQLRSKRRKQR